MKTFEDLAQILRAGSRLPVQFGPRINDCESYAEPGMRAVAVAAPYHAVPGMLAVTFDFQPFDAHNRGMESANYYDASGKPCLTAREANRYRPVDTLYFTPTDELPPWLVPLGHERAELYRRYVESGTAEPYVEWLEAAVLAGRSAAA